MVRLYTSEKYFDTTDIIRDNDGFFNNNINAGKFNARSIRAITNIDGAELLDAKLGTIKTPYGVTSIYNLSTGCKTVLNYIYLLEARKTIDDFRSVKAISANGCGWNAMEELFKVADECSGDLAVILEHDNDIHKCSERDYYVDDERHIRSLFSL